MMVDINWDDGDQFDSVITGLSDPSPGARLYAAWLVTRHQGPVRPDVVEALIAALERGGDHAFGMVMEALGHTGDRRAFRVLTGYLKSPNPYHRALAAQALGGFGDREAVALLTPLLEDGAHAWKEDHGPNRTVADVAREAMERLR